MMGSRIGPDLSGSIPPFCVSHAKGLTVCIVRAGTWCLRNVQPKMSKELDMVSLFFSLIFMDFMDFLCPFHGFSWFPGPLFDIVFFCFTYLPIPWRDHGLSLGDHLE